MPVSDAPGTPVGVTGTSAPKPPSVGLSSRAMRGSGPGSGAGGAEKSDGEGEEEAEEDEAADGTDVDGACGRLLVPADGLVTGCVSASRGAAAAEEEEEDDEVGAAGGLAGSVVAANPAVLPEPLRPCLGAGGGERMTPAACVEGATCANDDAALAASAATAAAVALPLLLLLLLLLLLWLPPAAAGAVLSAAVAVTGLATPNGCAVTVR